MTSFDIFIDQDISLNYPNKEISFQCNNDVEYFLVMHFYLMQTDKHRLTYFITYHLRRSNSHFDFVRQNVVARQDKNGSNKNFVRCIVCRFSN